jgi:prepilin-type N-terminal cleavage/methylation domain-containing protein/prepilin-type processing-associated H-X9-DG protein
MSCQAIFPSDAPLFASTQESKRISCRLTATDDMTNNRSPAFTLIEMIVVLAVIAIMMAMVYPAYTSISEHAKATKDMSNLRQIAMATQLYMNDNSNVFPGSATQTWMSQLELNQKYLSVWRILESPFDKRSTSESGDGTTAISYGINSNIYVSNVPISADKITKPTVFIVFAPTQKSGSTVSFQGAGNSAVPGVGVVAATSTPGGTATGGTHSSRTKINALFADWHAETMAWSGTGPAFTHTTDPGSDPDAPYRWSP